MALFKRNDKTTIAELEEYYANQRSNRSGMAWAMAFLSLFITVLVIAGLFFGGRWAYRSLANDDDMTIVTTGGQEDATIPSFGEIRAEDSNSDSDNDEVVVGNNGQSNTSNGSDGGVVSDEAATTTRGAGDTGDAGNVAGSSTNTNTDNQVGNNEVGATTEPNSTASTNENAPTSSNTNNAAADIPNTGAGELLIALPVVSLIAGYLYSRQRQLK